MKRTKQMQVPRSARVRDHALRASAVGAVMVVVMTLSSCRLVTRTPQGGAPPDPSTQVAPVVGIRIVDFAFVPAHVSIKVGTKIRWTNYGSTVYSGLYMGNAPHTVTFDDGSVSGSGHIQHLQSYEKAFIKPGVYAYHCEIHDSMTGTITVLP